MAEGKWSVKRIEVVLDKPVVLMVLVTVGISVLLAGSLAYLFSDSFITVLCGLVIGVTLGVLINYFILISGNIIKNVQIEVSDEKDQEELRTVMKIEQE
jgi:hypothetical protein